MSLRDVSNSVPLAVMADRDIRALVFINTIFLYHPPLLSIEGHTFKA